MRVTPNDILIWTMTRSVLAAYAKVLAHVNDRGEAQRLREALIAELHAIIPDCELPEIWRQATRVSIERATGPDGISAYALQRLGLWPEDKKDDDTGG